MPAQMPPRSRFFLLAATLLLALPVVLPLEASANTGTFIDKQSPTDLRVVTYNILSDSIFDTFGDQPEKFARVVSALQPDILNLQEVYEHSASEVAALIDSIVPLPGGATWQAYDRADNIIVSKYPILAGAPIAQGGASALIDLPDADFAKDLLVANDHWRCCDNEADRQIEADRLVRDLKNFRNGNGAFSVPADTPFVVLGDLNIVSSGQPLDTAITGNIINEFSYGSDSPPDWDGTSLTDAQPRHNATGSDDYTWRNDSSPFAPGRLDYILYSDSVISTANRFVLNTTTMTSAERLATGLQANDIVVDPGRGFFDHLPVVVDFVRTAGPEPIVGDYNLDGIVDAADYTVWRTLSGQLGPDLAADGNGDGMVNQADYVLWRSNYGSADSSGSTASAVPEPASGLLVVLMMIFLSFGKTRDT